MAASGEAKGIELKMSELTLILEGIELSSVKRRKRLGTSLIRDPNLFHKYICFR